MGIELNEKDALNLQEIKDKMAELATGKGLLGSPDAAAAVAGGSSGSGRLKFGR
jgi:hypothetical protein